MNDVEKDMYDCSAEGGEFQNMIYSSRGTEGQYPCLENKRTF